MAEPDDTQAFGADTGAAGRTLFPDRLPAPALASFGTLLVLLFAAAALVAVFVPFPDAVRCRFVLVPEGGADPVRAPRQGTLAGILVAETQQVKKGQDLFIVRSQEIRTWTSELATLQQEVAATEERLSLLEKDHRSELDIQARKVQQLEKDLAFQQEYLKTLQDFLARFEQLDREGLVPRVDLIAQRLAAARGERDVAMTRESRDMASLETTRVRNEYRDKVDSLVLARRKAALRIATLEKLLDKADEDVVRVTAPFDGTVVTLAKRNPGDVVSYGQELCRIARSDAVLIGELAPSEDAVARLATGQHVQLLYEAFPFERFGPGGGTLRWVSPAAVTTSNGERFVAHVSPDAPTLGPASEGRVLRAGMRGEARVVVGSKTLVEFALEPLRQIRETVGARPR